MRTEFGDEVALLVDGVTKLTKMSFKSSEEEQAENFRKMIIAMAKDIRVILIKLADRLHNMRTLCYLGKDKQIQKAKETLEIYAPLAHRLGIESVRWELEDLAFATLHPRKYAEIQQMVAQRRADREEYIEEARTYLEARAGEGQDRRRDLRSSQALLLHLRQDDPQGQGVQRDLRSHRAARAGGHRCKDCYAAVGIIHSLWKPLPGPLQRLHRHAQVQHVPVAAHHGHRTAGQAARDPDPHHRDARDRRVRHRRALALQGEGARRPPGATADKLQWLRQMMEWQSETKDATEFMESLRIDLFQDEVYVFTPKGTVKSLPAGSTPVDFAYAIHTDVGHRCVGAKVNGRIVPLTYRLQSGDIVEVLTSRTAQGPSRDWLNFVQSSSARNKIRQWFKRERREDSEHLGKEALLEIFRKHGLPAQKLMGSDTLGAGHEGDGLPEAGGLLRQHRGGQDQPPAGADQGACSG